MFGVNWVVQVDTCLRPTLALNYAYTTHFSHALVQLYGAPIKKYNFLEKNFAFQQR